jgi:hypothetical protein
MFALKAGIVPNSNGVQFFKSSFFSLLFVGNLDWIQEPFVIIGGERWWASRDFWGAESSYLEFVADAFWEMVGTGAEMEQSFIDKTIAVARLLGEQRVNEGEDLNWSRDQWELIYGAGFRPPAYDPNGEIDLIQELIDPSLYRDLLDVFAPLP